MTTTRSNGPVGETLAACMSRRAEERGTRLRMLVEMRRDVGFGGDESDSSVLDREVRRCLELAEAILLK